ncbi:MULTISPECIES: peptidogalycan biosysnthesis protein [unclassified Micromonospora]|uniref:peptidogalycan biosysnthesis protein n=1 Tax=unclassified Micromonospora TaxID=2617518 RepID=UPI003A869ECE
MAVAPVGFARYELSHDYSQQRFGEVFTEPAAYAVLGSRRGYRNPWLLHPELSADEQAGTVRLLVDNAVELAAGWQADAVVVPYLAEPDLAPLAGDPRLRAHRPAGTEAVLDTRVASFDGYLARLPSKRRLSVLRERAQARGCGLRFAIEPVGPDTAGALAGLMAQVETKYGRQVTVGGLRRYLDATFASDPHARLFTCRNSHGRLVTAAMAFEWRRALYVRATATDYGALPEGSFAHFSVLYYEPVEYCVRRGLDTVYYGMEALQAKLLRGCQQRSLCHALLRR